MMTQPTYWLAEQKRKQRQLLLIIDTVHSPDVIAKLFELAPLHDYIKLFQGTEFEDLLEQSPWLIRIDSAAMPGLTHLLQYPQLNWGWIASAVQIDLQEVAHHWRERLEINEDGKRWFYRFQDNQVIARHLAALAGQQIPLLLGPQAGALAWDGQQWQSFENIAPSLYPQPFATPWLEVPETSAVSNAINARALEGWLWNKHRKATYRLPVSADVWAQQQLTLAAEWDWNDAEHVLFLVEHKLDPALAEHPAWAKQTGETSAVHFARVKRTFATMTSMKAWQ